MTSDLYQRLGISKNASADEIKAAYRKLAKKNHPDVNPGDKAAEERFKSVTEAFEVLSDPQKRAMFDEFGPDAAKMGYDTKKAEAFRQYRRGGGAQGGIPFDFDFRGGGGFDPESIFAEMFGGGRRRRGPQPGGDLTAKVQLTLGEVVKGCERTLTVNGQRVTAKIPAGVDTGTNVRLAGQGAPGERGGPPGDLFLEVEVLPHPLLRRDGADLSLDLPITVAEAILGADVQVPTLSGTGTVTLRPGTQSGTKLRLKGRGVPTRGGPAGDLYLVVQIRVPETVTDDTRRAAELLQSQPGLDVRRDLKL
jgi:DnaJ-class molecular chaperone